MDEGMSKTIRRQGDLIAFDHKQWESQSRKLAYSANYLLESHVDMLEQKQYEGIALLLTSQFLVSIAIELISKAYFLKSENGKREDIFKHEVVSLCDGIGFSDRQKELMAIAESNVIWAGRYPTPKWKEEHCKEEYDVPSLIINSVEHIDAQNIKNSSSPQRVKELLELYSFVRKSWEDIT